MIVLGLILLLIGWLTGLTWLWTILKLRILPIGRGPA